MSLPAILTLGVEKAFTILREVVAVGTFYRANPGHSTEDYDPVTDTAVSPTVTTSVRMLPVGVEAADLAGTAVTVSDTKVLIPGADLAFVPRTNDYLLMRGSVYNVVRVKEVPGNPVYILFCRAR